MTDHYYTKNPKSELKIKEISANIFGKELIINTASGLFSKDRVDKGTLLLIENCKIKKKDKVLDLGCGYGVVGVSLAKEHDIKITFSDINSRALSLTKINCQKHNINDYSIVQSDGFQKISGKFDTILLNPPQTAGKEICIKMINDSANFLEKGGTLQIVARHNKGGKTLSKEMQVVYGNLETLTKKGGFRVYKSIH